VHDHDHDHEHDHEHAAPSHDARVTVAELTPVRRRLDVEIPAGEVQAELDRAFGLLGTRARLPGFRPGRAPRAILDRMFGAEVRREVLGRLVGDTFRNAIESHHLDVVGEPDIDAGSLTPGEALRYSATIDVRPVITLADVGSLEVRRPSAEVPEEEVERVIGNLRESVAQLRPIEDRMIVEAGDIVTVDVTSRREGQEPVRREGVLLEAGGGSFPQALERQLVGQHRGAHLSLKVPYPAEHPNRELAGTGVEFDVEIKDLRAKELPALDDEFARDHGRCESLADLRGRIRADLERQAATRADDVVREGVLDQVIARHTFEVPPSLVERRTRAIISTLDVRLPPGADQEKALEEVAAQVRPRADRQVRSEMILDEMARRDGVEVTDAEVAGEVEALAASQKDAAARVRSLYGQPEARAALMAQMRRERVLRRLVSEARVVPETAEVSVAHEIQTR
jgi:trigger factor